MAEKDKFLSTIHKRRLQALRKLTDNRKRLEALADPDKFKRDIIKDYANYDSHVYAPITRLGSTLDRNAAAFDARPEILASLEGLMELEATLPQSMTTTMIKKPSGRKAADPHAARKDATLGKHLAFMDTAIQKKKDAAAGLSTSTRSMADKYAVVKPVERPPVPEVSPPQVDEELDRSGESTALSPLPLIFSYKSEKSLCGAGPVAEVRLTSTFSLATHVPIQI